MTVRELGRRLEISPSLVSRYVKRGMPLEEKGAREWRTTYLRANESRRRGTKVGVKAIDFVDSAEGEEDLAATLGRLRKLERTTAATLERLLKEGQVSEAASLRREHVAVVKAVYDAESKSLRIDESRGRLISVDRALSMINEAMQSAILVLRRLPELGRDPEQRQTLEAFMNGVLAEIKVGAADGLKSAA